MAISTEDDKLLSPEALDNFILVSNIFTAATLIFGFLSVFIIFRYTTKSMSDYKYHLLNITLTIFCSDMCFHVLCRPYLLYPVIGLCMVGELETIFGKAFGLDATMRAISFIQVFCTVSSMASITNATIHRYALAAKLVHPTSGLFFNKYFLALIMLTLQVVWPVIGCILCLNMEMRPDYAIRENIQVSEQIMQRTKNHTCFISSRDLTSILQTVYPTALILLLGITCAGGSMLIVFLCWRKIIQAQRGCVSRKTISMQKDLMISLGIQAFTPNILFLICLGVVVISFLSASQWTGLIGTIAFRIGSTHTTANFLIMSYTIPTFHKGIVRDFKYFVCRRKTNPALLWATTSSSRI